MSSNLDKGYQPRDVEARWYSFWETNGLFAAKENSENKPYSIVIPPPNVTGVLHMGHALNITLQDILCRYRRSKGDNVLWMPGTDHAGIATQNVVEKHLASENTTRHELGREAFIERVWEWRKEYGSAIINQLKRLGASCDWDRERFTMDKGLSRAVRKVFVQLYEQGLIYRGDYIINWCPRCNTALADLEVEHEQQEGHLYHILYPFADAKGGLIVATTRPETMLGDTALAINPKDKRYADITSEQVILPLMDRKIPIIRDSYVDTKFGTGALKVTPAHDVNDFEIGLRHDLPRIKVIGEDGLMTQEAGKFAGLDRFECREKVLKALKKQGLLKKVETHEHGVGHCYRCKTTVEPNLSKQWFIKAAPLAEKAIKAVKNGDTRIIPDTWEKTYFEWLNNIRDWCISRQIWWGHRIPAWTCSLCGEIVVSMETPDKCPVCKKNSLEQETDVLDTWFSSALWPFSTMGWPDSTDLLKTFYPTSVLVTGFDILFFWVARMMMMGLHFMEDVPFKDVYIHALVRDSNGKKMSKSKGNVIDPLEVIESQGTDAFRFTLAAFAAMGRDIKLSVDRIEGYRHFINKLWNAARFTLTHISENPDATENKKPATLQDRWILSRLHHVTRQVEKSLDTYKFNEAASTLYKFVWHEFCDWYLESIKPILYDKTGDFNKNATVATLNRVLTNVLVLLHPFIPFVTEELWHRLPNTADSIMKAPFPAHTDKSIGLGPDPDAEAAMERAMGIVTAIRNIRGEMNIPPSMALCVIIRPADDETSRAIADVRGMIQNLAKLDDKSPALLDSKKDSPKGAATAVFEGNTIYVLLKGVVDLEKEKARIEKEIAKLTKELVKLDKKLANEDFLARAPSEIVEKVRGQQSELAGKRDQLELNLEKVLRINAD